MTRLKRLKSVLWLLAGAGLVTIVARLGAGLGAVTNLSHNVSWGLWNALKISIVPLSAGGFVLAAIVYVLRKERYRPLLRLAILTGFLGYSTFAIMLIFDLGVPYRIWHPMVFWQHHSVLFEVAWCVMLYLTVLLLEFAPNVLEHPGLQRPLYQKAYRLLKGATVPLVIAGIVLSTLHQSSLGSLFLIVPHRLDPLWYSPLIYVLFLISAVGMGLLLITVQAFLLQYFYGVKAPTNLLAPLARAGAVAMLLFAVVRVLDQLARGVSIGSSSMGAMFVIEMLLAAVLPALLLWKRVAGKRGALVLCTTCSALGVVLYRFNVALVAIDWGEGAYFPAWTEFALCFGILAGVALAFLLMMEKLDVYYGPAGARIPASDDLPADSVVGAAFESQLVRVSVNTVRGYSLLALIGATLALAFLPRAAVLGLQPRQTPVAGVRVIEASAAAAPGQPLPAMWIDGDGNDNGVLFDHAGHTQRLGGNDACGKCHHLSLPGSTASACHSCHRDMYVPTSIFRHPLHVRRLGGNAGCQRCHADSSVAKTRETSTPCAQCHADSVHHESLIAPPAKRWRAASGYKDAMHGLCITCHANRVSQQPDRYPKTFLRCDACHHSGDDADSRRLALRKAVRPGGRPGD